LTTLFKAQLLFWMLAAAMATKNFSIRILAGGHYQLTLLYDVLSAWPVIGNRANQTPIQKARLAMADGINSLQRLRTQPVPARTQVQHIRKTHELSHSYALDNAKYARALSGRSASLPERECSDRRHCDRRVLEHALHPG
jgi:serine/threonine protein kinase HipA of HipAB toxin-antitoxin module